VEKEIIADETPMSINRIGISIISHNNVKGFSDFLLSSELFAFAPMSFGFELAKA